MDAVRIGSAAWEPPEDTFRFAADVLGDAAAGQWWVTPNEHLGGERPADMAARGEGGKDLVRDILWRVVEVGVS
jgi:uncharacterized protein (DUF2384 family)